MKASDITTSNVQNFFQGYYQQFKGYYDSIEPHIKEQAEWRAYLCQPCASNTKCLHCGCATPGMFFAPSKTDSLGKWSKMLPADEWEDFKKLPRYQEFISLQTNNTIAEDDKSND